MTENKTDHSFVSGHWIALYVIFLLSLCIVIDLIAIAHGYSQIALLSQQVITEEEAAASESRQQLIAVMQVTSYIITGILFLIWIYRVQRNLPALGVARPRYTPGWAVGWFFVPIMNLVRPYDVVKELWKDSNPDAGISDTYFNQYPHPTRHYSSKTSLIGLWWGFWIGTYVAGRISMALLSQPNGKNEFVIATWADMISAGMSIIAGVFAILIVKEIDTRQEEKHRRLVMDSGLQDSLAAGQSS